MKSGGQRPVAKVLLVLVLTGVSAWLIFLLVGCGSRQARIVLSDGQTVMCETYNVTSEGVIDCGNAADRLQFSRFCADPEHAKLDVCKTHGHDRAPSDSPKELHYSAPSGQRPCRGNKGEEYFPGVCWY